MSAAVVKKLGGSGYMSRPNDWHSIRVDPSQEGDDVRTQFYLTDIPLVLRDALEVRARTEGTSVTAVIDASLCKRYGLEATPGRKMSARFGGGEYVRPNGQPVGIAMNLELPTTVVKAVREESGASGKPQRTIVLSTLAATLGVELPKPHNRRHGRPRGRKVKA